MALPGEQRQQRRVGSAKQQQKWPPETRFTQQLSAGDARPLPLLPFPKKSITCIKSGPKRHFPGSSEDNLIY